MVVAEVMKPSVKVSVSESESSDVDDGAESEHNSESDASAQGSNDESAQGTDDESAQGSDDESAQGSADGSAQGSADESDQGSDVENESGDDLVGNEGWADSVAKILGSSKPKNKKTLVLSRAKKFSEIKKETDEKPTFEVIGEEVKEEKPKVKKDELTTEPPVKKRKIDKPSIRVKPNILQKDRERLLSKVATKGVVQLFNAVRNQQKTMDKEMDNSVTETKKEKVLKRFDKRMFLDSLMGNTKSVIVDKETKSTKDEVKAEEKPKWNALRDDFMMGAKMKDWDKESVDE
ncbi:RRP15-like protein isoform X2 [Epargyreus clarus]|uniref:RRP15-like protein isoform X2 n=1 Tax=Epargyreus clarus TaxID=520877 RepID=UPI003C2E03C8